MRITIPAGTPDVDLRAVRLFDPDLYADGDPHTVWKALRERSPVHHETLADGREFWSVTRYRDVCRVLRDSGTFTSERGTLLCALDLGDPAGGLMMAATDPPRHAVFREPLTRVLSAQSLSRQQEPLRLAVHRMLADLRAGAVWDVAGSAAAFPMVFTGTLMGLPEPDWPRLVRLTTMAIAPDDAEFQEGTSVRTLAAAHHELFDYFSEQLSARGGWPTDDIVGFLMRMRVDGRPLSHDEIVYNCYSLLLGANVTTPHTVSATVLAFAEQPEAWQRLGGSPELLPAAVEEGLRWSSPANHFMRYTRHETEIAGQRLPAGAAVAAWLGSANRDDAFFPDPYRFDVGRTGNRHVAFGFGPHYCVGAPLARLTLRMLFGELIGVVEDFELAGPVRHLRSNFVAGITSLPVSVRTRPDAARRLSGVRSEAR